eukprot:3083830-Lingulodinium_polyedra.AAC.1
MQHCWNGHADHVIATRSESMRTKCHDPCQWIIPDPPFTRRLWSYLMRLLRRSAFSRNVSVARLKILYRDTWHV